jgi:PAS domain-containing protein
MVADRAAEVPQVPFLRRIASRVGLKLTLVLAAVIILVEAIVLVPSYFGLRADLLEQTRSEAVTALSATLKAEMAMHEGKVSDVGAVLAKEGFLRGGVLYDIAGAERGAFGARPTFGLAQVEAGETGALLRGGAIYEFFVPHDEAGLVFNAILSVEATGVTDRLTEFLINVGLIVLFLAVTCVCGIACAVDAVVLNRILRMRWAVVQAETRPDIADRFALQDRTSDEVGDLGRSLDRLLYTVSNTYQEDLAVALAITENSTIATLIYDGGGALVGANAAAHRLFGAPDTADLAARDSALVALADSQPMSPVARLKDGALDGKGYAITDTGRVPCLFAGQTITRGDGTVLRHVATLIDLTDHEVQVRGERKRRRAAEDRVEELRASLAACMALLSSSPAQAEPETAETHRILPERLVGDWAREQTQSGRLGRDDVRHGVLPPITVPRGVAEDLFRNALSLALMRVGGRGHVKVDAERAGDNTYVFVFEATPARPGASGLRPGAEAGIVASAVRLLATRAGGEASIPDANASNGGFTARITLSDRQDRDEAA